LAKEVSASADAIGYSADPSIAAHKGFRREASIALEPIIKAFIVQTASSPNRARKLPELRRHFFRTPAGEFVCRISYNLVVGQMSSVFRQ
jgi:hypothetical protein